MMIAAQFNLIFLNYFPMECLKIQLNIRIRDLYRHVQSRIITVYNFTLKKAL
jgi:hypothetical protein